MSDQEAKQRLMTVLVGEVSLVDHPANESDFILIKSIEAAEAAGLAAGILKAVWSAAFINDLPDSAFLYVAPGGSKDADGKTTPRSLRHFPYKDDKGKVDLPHLRNALARIPQADIPDGAKERATAEATRILNDRKDVEKAMTCPMCGAAVPDGAKFCPQCGAAMTQKAAQVSKAELVPEVALNATLQAIRDKVWAINDRFVDGDVAGAVNEMEKMKVMLTSAQQLSQEAQAVVKSIDGFIVSLQTVIKGDGKDGEKKPMPPWMKDEMKKLLDTVKSLMDEVDQDVTLAADGNAVAKGLKQFSKDRLAKLKDSLKSLATMVKEIDADGFGEFIAAFNPPSGAAAVAATGVNAGGSIPAAVAKADTAAAPSGDVPSWAAALQSGLDTINKSLGGLTQRVETVEKGQATPKTLPENGTDNAETKPVEKKKSFWSGVV